MPVYAASHSFEAPILESVPYSGEEQSGAYPFPFLRSSGAIQSHEVATVVLENEYLRAAVAPGLGGRIVSLFDKRFQREALPALALGEGRRGARLAGGIELSLNGRERLNAMGPVDCQVLEEEDAVVLGELSSGAGVSWHMRISVSPGRAAVQIAVRVANRTLEPVPYRAGMIVPDGVHVVADPGVLVGAFRTEQAGRLSGRQVDSWACELIPSSLKNGIAGRCAVCSIEEGLKIEALEPMLRHKVALEVEGQTMALLTDLYPEALSKFDVPAVPQSIAIISPEGEVTFLWPPQEGLEAELRRRLLHAGERGAGYVGLALLACRQGNLDEADAVLDDALTFNGDDPLAWWLKAVIQRHKGEVEERPELLNAHFLAPFEPALRAESFLSTSHDTKEPSPLVRPLADNPDAMIEVAVLLAEAGFRDDLSRWVDECLRHRDIPMLRYILADALLTDSRMEVEAAQFVQQAKDKPIAPPYPWRHYERKVLARLTARFPLDARIADLLRGLEAHLLPKI